MRWSPEKQWNDMNGKRNIVTTTSVFPPCSDLEKVLHVLAEIGYDGADIAFDYCVQQADYPFLTDGYADWAEALRRTAETCGIVISHGHASFDASCRDARMIRRTMHCCQIMGIRYLVVHPIWQNPDGAAMEDGQAFVDSNAQAYAQILDIAAEYGVTVLSENLLWGASADPAVIAALVDRTAHPHFGWCYDTGHAKSLGYAPSVLVGHTAPLSLHMQDNLGHGDDHLLPGDGAIDWDDVTAVLKEIGYRGDAVLEAHHQPLEAKNERERKSILIDLFMRAVRLEQDMRIILE